MIFNRAVHLKAVKGQSLLQALYQLMTELHFPLISFVIPLLALQPNLWLKHLSSPDQHLNVKTNRTTWQNWPYVRIAPKLSLIYVSVEASAGRAGSWWAQSHKPVFRHGILQRGRKSPNSGQADCTADVGEQKAGKESTSHSKVPGASTRKIFLNEGIRTISLKGKGDLPDLGSWRQPTKLAQHCRAPWHWVLTTHSIWISHTESSRDCLQGLSPFHRPPKRLSSALLIVKIIIPMQPSHIRTDIDCFEMWTFLMQFEISQRMEILIINRFYRTLAKGKCIKRTA